MSDDLLTGTSGADLLYGGAGDDTVSGLDGADTISGGDGEDVAYGGAGADIVSGGLDDDTVEGGAGADTLDGGDGLSLDLSQGAGDFTAWTQERSTVSYVAATDAYAVADTTASGWHGVDTTVSGLDGGQDQMVSVVVKAGSKSSVLFQALPGGTSATTNTNVWFDLSTGSATLQQNTVSGATWGSNDLGDGWYQLWIKVPSTPALGSLRSLVRASSPSQTQYAGDGSTVFSVRDYQVEHGVSAPTDPSTVTAGDIDTLSYAASSAGVNVSLATAIGSGGDADGDQVTEFERVIGSGHADTLAGDAEANILSGGAGADLLSGGDGADTLVGGVGADTLSGGVGTDVIEGTAAELDGDTLADFEAGADQIHLTDVAPSQVASVSVGGGVTTVTVYAVDGVTVAATFTVDGEYYSAALIGDGAGGSSLVLSSTITGTAGADSLVGSGSDDDFNGLAGDDTIVADGGGDTVSGGSGNDALYGGAGADVLTGGADSDTLVGGADADTLSGGAGIDIFVGSASDLDGDVITDISASDQIVVLGADLSALNGQTVNGILDLGGGNTLTLSNISAGTVSASYDTGSGATTLAVTPDSGGTAGAFTAKGAATQLFLPSEPHVTFQAPSVLRLSNGDVIVGINSDKIGGGGESGAHDITGIRLDPSAGSTASATRVGTAFELHDQSQNAAYRQGSSNLVELDDGTYLSSFTTTPPHQGGFAIYRQNSDAEVYRFDTNDSILGAKIEPAETSGVEGATELLGGQQRYAYSAGLDGKFVTVYQNYGDIVGRFYEYDSSGVTAGSTFTIDSDAWGQTSSVTTFATKSYLHTPQVQALADGGFMVAWVHNPIMEILPRGDVMVRFYDSDGTARTNEIAINDGQYPVYSTTALMNGNVVAVWHDGEEVRQSVLTAEGETITSTQQVNLMTEGQQELAHVASLDSGGWVVTWSSDGHTYDDNGVTKTDPWQVIAQVYREDGSMHGGEIVIGALSSGIDEGQRATAIDDGFAVFWSSGSGNVNVSVDGAPVGQYWQADTTARLAFGTSGANTLYAAWGDDTLSGAGGDDYLFADAGDDLILGGDGDDTLWGAGGNDTMSGGAGNDLFVLSGGADAIVGGDGLDIVKITLGVVDVVVDLGTQTISGRNLNDDTISGIEGVITEGGDDSVTGSDVANDIATGNGDDTAVGGLGNDTLSGGTGNDALSGGGDDDDLSGGAGNDTLSGGDGADTLSGGAGADAVFGGAGNDVLVDGGAGDTLDGGDGVDRLSFVAAGQGVAFSLSSGTSPGGSAITSIEGLIGSAFADTLTGDAGGNLLLGGAGADALSGGGGDDTLSGGSGTDMLTLGSGVDDIVGTAAELGGDSVSGFGEDDRIVVQGSDLSGLDGGIFTGTVDLGGGNTLTVGGIASGLFTAVYDSGTDATTITVDESTSGTAGDDTLVGASGADTLSGADGHDRLIGLGGSDALSGGAGNDILSGGADGDALFGGDGDDTVSGGAGADTLSGGVGADAFAGTAAELGGDTVADFAGGDRIVVKGADLSALGDQLAAGTLDLGGGNLLTVGGLPAGSWSAVYDGGSGDTTLSFLPGVGTSGDDSLAGTAGADTLSGLGGSDSLYGNDGADLLEGADGNDLMSGGDGADTLSGGTGNDVFVLSAGDGNDVILDFAAGSDVIDLDAAFGIVDQAALDAAASDDGSGNAVLDFGNGDSLKLIGVNYATLSIAEFA